MKHCDRFSRLDACSMSFATWSVTLSTMVGLKSRPGSEVWSEELSAGAQIRWKDETYR